MVVGVLLVFEVPTLVLYAISGDTLAAIILVLHEVKMVLDLMACFNFRRFALVILVLMSPCSLSNDCWFESIIITFEFGKKREAGFLKRLLYLQGLSYTCTVNSFSEDDRMVSLTQLLCRGKRMIVLVVGLVFRL